MYTGPHLIKDNLVFGYDTGYGVADNNTSTRFYKGEPGANLWDSMLNTQSLRTHTKHYWDGNRWTENSTYTDPGVSGPIGTYLGLVFKHVSGALSNNWGGTSYGYMLRDIACTNGATMTMSSWIYASADCNLDSIPAVIEGEAGDESLVSGFPGAYDLNNKGTWQVTAKKATSDGNTRFIPLYPRKNGVTNGSFTGFFMWALPQVTYGNNVVPPIQPGSTRLSTQSLIDIKKTTDINVSNISFDSTGQPTFDGTDDILNTGLLSGRNPATDPFTIEAIVKSDTTSGAHMWLDATSNGTNQRLYCAHASAGSSTPLGIQNSGWSHTIPQDTNYHHYVITMNGSTAELWNNGTSHSNKAYTSYTLAGQINVGGRGGYRWVGKIPVFKIHNGVLTADQVKQNYNAYKNRFDI